MANNKQTETREGAFVKDVSAVSVLALLVLIGLLGLLWLNRDSLYAFQASSQIKNGRYDAAILTVEKISKEPLRLRHQYDIAGHLYENGAYSDAKVLFDALGDYSDSHDRSLQCSYALADQLYQSGDFEGALSAFTALGSYSDSPQRQQQTIYAMAGEAFQTGDLPTAVTLYLSVSDYSDSGEKAFEAAYALTGDKAMAQTMLESGGQTQESLEKVLLIAQRRALFPGTVLAAGAYHTVILYADGTVAACGDNTYGQCDVRQWQDIVQIAAGAYHTLGLRADGTVVAAGRNDQGQCNVEAFTGITQIAAGDSDSYALSRSGQVFMTGYHTYDAITRAVEVRSIYAGSYAAVAATANGSFVATHDTYVLKPNSQILSVGLNTGYVLTQYLDGRLVSSFDIGGDWEDIVSFDAGARGIIATDLSGRVISHFFRESDTLDFSSVENACQCAAGASHFVFLLEDGSLAAFGDNTYGQCNVGSLTGNF